MADREIHKARPIGELLADFIHGSELEQPLLERKIVALWPMVLGATVAQMTGEVEVKNGVLYVHVYSAALRSQLFDIRHDLVRKLNEAAGANVLKDIRLLG
jgi:predicted nucleic acid-binding Zn ribbon protein